MNLSCAQKTAHSRHELKALLRATRICLISTASFSHLISAKQCQLMSRVACPAGSRGTCYYQDQSNIASAPAAYQNQAAAVLQVKLNAH